MRVLASGAVLGLSGCCLAVVLIAFVGALCAIWLMGTLFGFPGGRR